MQRASVFGVVTKTVAKQSAVMKDTESFARAMDLLIPGRARRLIDWGTTYFVPLQIVALSLMLLFATVRLPWVSWLFLALAVVVDWAGALGIARIAKILELSRFEPHVRYLLRSVIMMVGLAGVTTSHWVPVGYSLVVFAAQIAWLAAIVSAAWLMRRQPPLEYTPRGAGNQPEDSLRYARVYARSVGVIPAIVLLDWVALLVLLLFTSNLLGGGLTVGLVAAVVVALLGYGLWVALSARSANLRGPDIEAAVIAKLEASAPTVIIYSSAGAAESNYILNQWSPTFAAIAQPSFMLVREANQLGSIKPVNIPAIWAPTTRHVERLVVGSVRVAFYLANAGKNVHLLREARIKHVFLNHGDSDKSTSANPVARGYDEVWVAGQAAVDRYRAAGVDIPDSQFAIVGRPQVQSLVVGPLHANPKTILYAPTFEGYYEESNYSSLESMGPEMMRRIMQEFPDVRIWFKPHPASGVQRPGMRIAREEINHLLLGTSKPGHKVLDDDPTVSLQECFSVADVLISDISSVVTDFLQAERPIITANPRSLAREDFYATFPTQQGSYVLDRDLSNLTEVLRNALGPDPMAAERLRMKTYVLGDVPDGALQAFALNTARIIDQSKVDAARITNEFKLKL